MKTLSLLLAIAITLLIAIALPACSASITAESKPAEAAHNGPTISGTYIKVQHSDNNWNASYVLRTCIDGVSYLMYSHTIIVQVDPDNKPVKCN